MATTKRTQATLILVIVFLCKIHCENDAPQRLDRRDTVDAEHLLRGSGEVSEGDASMERMREVELVAENEETATSSSQEDGSAWAVETTTELLGYAEYEEGANGDGSVTGLTVTESAGDYTVALDRDNNVYIDGSVDGDQDIQVGYNDSTRIDVVKVETTTMPPTTKGGDDVDVASRREEEDVEATGSRSPKTEDNKEPKQMLDKRNFDNKTRPPVAVSRSSTLRGWLEDAWLRPPAGVLVPLRPMALNRALAVWNDLTSMEGLNVTDIVIVGYDSNGVNWRSRHNLQGSSYGGGNRAVSEALSKLLLKYQGIHSDSASDGTMKALASAAKLVPYDSALFVVTDKGPGDPQRLPLALRALVEKRLKVYTIWTDPNYPSTNSELALQELKNVSKHTEGDVLPYSLQVMETDSSTNLASDLQKWTNMQGSQSRKAKLISNVEEDAYSTLLVRRGGGGAISLGFPVENGVTALRVYIEGAVEHAVLYPPNEAPQIDLYNVTSVHAFSPASRTGRLNPRDVYLVFPGSQLRTDKLSVLPATSNSEAPAATVGLWHLSVRCDTCDYRLLVAARGLVHLDAEVAGVDMLKLRVEGPVASVRESVIVDEYGSELSKLPFSYQPIAGDDHEEPAEGPGAELVTSVPLPRVKGSRTYAKIVGRDLRGEPFVRLSGPLKQQSEVRMGRSAAIVFPESSNDLERVEEFNTATYNSRLTNTSSLNNRAMAQVTNQGGAILTALQIGLSSRLYGSPGDNLQLHFEVTNYREQAVRFSFRATGELRFLRGISPASQTINAGQTAVVVVSVGITTSAQPGLRDLITFTATGLEEVSISAHVYVVASSNTITDVWAPELRHNFQGTCIGRQGGDCAQHAWSATVVARDALAGLLRLSSSPVGLFYDSSFVSGSREEVIATYRATCCAPRVLITAVDAFGNANSYIVDISNYFSPAAIAAIVLGVLLLIALIGLLVFLIYWCVRRRRESRELPSYNTSSSRNVS